MNQIALFLYTTTDIIARPWADAGITCYLFDLLNDGKKDEDNIRYISGDIRSHRALIGQLIRHNKVVFVGAFPPCTDLAVSGARHFEKKCLEDAMFWAKSMEHVHLAMDVGEISGAPWFVENPKSMIATLCRPKDHSFNPYEFGGYLNSNHIHAYYPDIYPPQDAYNKETWLWTGGGFQFPIKKPVAVTGKDNPGWLSLGGKSERTKHIRSITPAGFSQAVFEANYQYESLTQNA